MDDPLVYYPNQTKENFNFRKKRMYIYHIVITIIHKDIFPRINERKITPKRQITLQNIMPFTTSARRLEVVSDPFDLDLIE